MERLSSLKRIETLTQRTPSPLPPPSWSAQVRLFRSPPSPGSSSLSSAELRLPTSLVKKLVFSIPDCGDGYKLLVQSLSFRFYTHTNPTR